MKKIINLEDARRIAHKRLPKFAFDFIDGGADDETTVQENQRAFSDIKFRPRVLIDVSDRDTSTTILGEPVKIPVMLAPAGGARLTCRDGELAAARAAGHEGAVYALTTASNFSMEDVAKEANGPLWFQLYPLANRNDTAEMVERAQKAGYKALCVCVDVATPGKRERDIRNKATIPPKVSWNKMLHVLYRPSWIPSYLFGAPITLANYLDLESFRGMSRREVLNVTKYKGPTNPSLTWDDLTWLRGLWKGPLVVKGIMNPEDAGRVLDHGANGIVVSNHGGRQLDGQLATIEVLPEIVEAVAGRAEVFIDSGIRRGTDVVKALALGARGVMIGRPYLFGLATGGAAGAIQVLQILRDEIDRTMALLGCRTVADINRSHVRLRKKISE